MQSYKPFSLRCFNLFHWVDAVERTSLWEQKKHCSLNWRGQRSSGVGVFLLISWIITRVLHKVAAIRTRQNQNRHYCYARSVTLKGENDLIWCNGGKCLRLSQTDVDWQLEAKNKLCLWGAILWSLKTTADVTPLAFVSFRSQKVTGRAALACFRVRSSLFSSHLSVLKDFTQEENTYLTLSVYSLSVNLFFNISSLALPCLTYSFPSW